MSSAARKLLQVQASAAEAASDDDFANVVLLLDGDGTSGDANNTFTDSSTNGFTVTESGSVVQGSFSPYGDNWSVYFDGSSYLNTASGATALGTGAFTVEFWINTTDTSFNIMNPDSSTGNGFWGLMVQSGDLRWNNQYNLTNLWVVDGAPILDGQWHHVAIVSSSSVFKVFYDGVSQSIQSGSFTDSYNYPYNDGLRIGSGNLATFKGYLSNIRLVSGTAIYSSDFDVPTGPFTNSASYTEKLLACQSNRFIDNGNSSYSITTSGSPKVTPFSPFKDDDARDITTDGGSGYLGNGAGLPTDYLSISDATTFDIGSNQFTFECWVYLESINNSFAMLFAGVSANYYLGYYEASGGGLTVYADQAGTDVYSGDDGRFNLYEWNHVVFQRGSGNLAMYLNGTQVYSASYSSTFGTSTPTGLTIGASDSYSDYGINGYIADARISNGYTLYGSGTNPSSITVPTAPLTAISNTDLLLNFQDAGIYDRSGINNIDTVGTAQIDTAVKKYGTGSLEINETGNYLKIPSGSLGQALKGDAWQNKWTVECWVRSNSWTTYEGIWMIYQDQNNWIRLFKDTGDTFQVRGYTGGSQQFSVFGGTATDSTFQHLAAVRDGSTIKLYVDGTSVGTPDTVHTLPTFSDSTEMYIGRENFSTNHYLQGFVDDFRITLGVARYTANFTPPTAALPKF